MNTRDFWTEVRRGFIAIVNALAKARPDDPLTLDIRIVERSRTTTSTI
jgi:hypothetical protein